MSFAADQLAVFQGGPSRTGGNDEHIWIDIVFEREFGAHGLY
jgi:hypothetical protein